MSDWTADEQRAIDSLKRLARRWPQSLTLFSWSGSLVVVHTDEYRSDMAANDWDSEQILGIPNDGGDP